MANSFTAGGLIFGAGGGRGGQIASSQTFANSSLRSYSTNNLLRTINYLLISSTNSTQQALLNYFQQHQQPQSQQLKNYEYFSDYIHEIMPSTSSESSLAQQQQQQQQQQNYFAHYLQSFSKNNGYTSIINSNSEIDSELFIINWRHPLLSVLLMSLCLLTIAGNCLVVVAVCTKKYLRNPTGYLIVSLAFADLIVGMIVMPLNSFFEMTQHVWLLGLPMCDLFHALDILASTSSIWNLCVISLDRYMAGYDPIGYRDRVSKRRITFAILFVWIISAFLSFPAIIWWRKSSPHLYDNKYKCLFTDNKLYVVFSSMVSFYIPLILILFAYGRVFLIATRHSQSLKSGIKKVQLRRRGKSIKRLNNSNNSLNVNSNTKINIIEADNNCQQRNLSIGENSGSTLRIHFGRNKIRKTNKKIELVSNGITNSINNGNISTNCQFRGLLGDTESPDSIINRQIIGRLSAKNGEFANNINTNSMDRLITSPRISRAPNTTTTTNSQRIFKYSASSATLLDANTRYSMKSLLNYPIQSTKSSNHHQLTKKQSIVSIEKQSIISSTMPLTSINNSNPSLIKWDLDANPGVINDQDGSEDSFSSYQNLFNTDNQNINQKTNTNNNNNNCIKQNANKFSLTSRKKASGMREKSRQMMKYVHEQRAARTLSIVVGVFILCWTPFFILSPIMVLCKTCIGNRDSFFSIITWAGHLNSMLNPLIYSRFSRDFRKAFKQILTCERERSTKKAIKTPLNLVLAQLASINQYPTATPPPQQQQQQASPSLTITKTI